MERKLSHTALVILGLLSSGTKSGYDIKRIVDRSTRFFWSASYGQIYPELRGLTERGLVRGEPGGQGGRARTVHELTRAGREALESWLHADDEFVHEIRDEGMLKLFFADAADPEARLANLAAMRRRYDALARRLRDEIEPLAAESPGAFPLLTARFGAEYYEWLVDWCDRAEAELRAASSKRTRRARPSSPTTLEP